MNITFSDIETHVVDGKSAAEIVTALRADTRHVRDVMATSSDTADTDLLDVLGDFGLLTIKPDATWGGLLPPAIEAVGSDQLTAGFERLLMNLQITNRPVRCGAVPAIGALLTAIVNVAASVLGDHAAAMIAAMDNLTGGLRFAGVTEADVQAVIDQHAAEAAAAAVAEQRSGWQSRIHAALNTIGTSEQAAGVADLRAIANEIEA